MIGDPAGVRLACFFTVIGITACTERLWPRRPPTTPAVPRWTSNLTLMAAGSVLARLAAPVGAAGAALWTETHHLGLLNQTAWPFAAKAVLTVAWLDLVVYWQHRVFHRVPLLWRLHAVHHTDLDLDSSSAVRFHPVEIVLSMGVKMAAVALVGAPFVAVTLFEILLNATAVFNHGNLGIPARVDAILRRVLVTPDMHRVHHTTLRDEQDSNFGFSLPWWDRLFGTYRDQPRESHTVVRLGLAAERDSASLGALSLLLRPFRRA